MNKIKLSLVAALLAGTTTLSADFASDVELSANAALTSNYVWRGMTQTGNNPTVQGGVDVSYKGAYIGLWGSGIQGGASTTGNASSEFDIYAGYANEIADFSYDIGVIQYMYPSNTEALNFSEAYLSLGYDFGVVAVSGMYYMGLDAKTSTSSDFGDGWELGLSVPLPMEISIDGTYGEYDDKNTATGGNANAFGDYYSISASKSFGKFDFTLAYTGMDYEDTTSKDEDNVVLTVGTSF